MTEKQNPAGGRPAGQGAANTDDITSISPKKQKIQDFDLDEFIVSDNGAKPSEAEERPRYVIRSAKDAFLPQEAIAWTVQDLISQGSVNVFSGAPGCKKTWCCLSLACSVALGIDWCGKATKQGKVLIIDEESGERRLSQRLRMAISGVGGDETTPIDYISLAGWNLREANEGPLS